MKKIQIFLFFITAISSQVLAEVNHYTDYVYENYLKDDFPNKEDSERYILNKKRVKQNSKYEYYDYLIKTDKEIKQNLEVKKIFENDRDRSKKRLTDTKTSLRNINKAIENEIKTNNKKKRRLEFEKAKLEQEIETTEKELELKKQEIKNIEKTKDTPKANNKKKSISLRGLYFQAGTGISHLFSYNVSTKSLFLNNNKTKNDEYNNSMNIIIGYYLHKELQTELEYSKQSFINNDVNDVDRNIMKSYTQNINMSLLGMNVMYPITFPTQKLQISFGLGAGVAKTYLSDFGSVYMKNGKIVDKTLEPTAILTNFKSEKEKNNVFYLSPKISASVLLNKNLDFIFSAKYDLFNDIKTDEELDLKNLSAVNLSVGIKYKFN